MATVRIQDSKTQLSALEAAASLCPCRALPACSLHLMNMRNALIAARRAEGRYQAPFDWQPVALIGAVFILSGLVLLALF